MMLEVRASGSITVPFGSESARLFATSFGTAFLSEKTTVSVPERALPG